MISSSLPMQAANKIKALYPDINPRIGIVLGSGLGKLTESLQDRKKIPYAELPGFPNTSVDGHGGNLIIGRIENTDVVCLEGRSHTYENNRYDEVKTYVRTLKCLGCEYFLATNASGSFRKEVGPGELVLVSDHINFQGGNPLSGPNDDEFGPRFTPMDDTYHPLMRDAIKEKAKALNIPLHEGIYISVLGPSYETVAEIKAFRLLGADVIGMSTVPEVIVAKHCGLKIAVIATVTNYTTDLATESHAHDDVVAMANKAAVNLELLVKAYIVDLSK
jgi:xanthosine phosphorylase